MGVYAPDVTANRKKKKKTKTKKQCWCKKERKKEKKKFPSGNFVSDKKCTRAEEHGWLKQKWSPFDRYLKVAS